MTNKSIHIIVLILKILWLPAIIGSYFFIINFLHAGYGYNPEQPVHFSHKVHSGDYKIKCLFCHLEAEKTSFSAIPSLYSCMVCHTALKTESDKMKPLIKSYDSRSPIYWVRIYRLPEYAHFRHDIHINSNIDCMTCHQQVETMETTYKTTNMTMKWCLDCHKEPEKFIVPSREITGTFQNPLKTDIFTNPRIKTVKSDAYTYPEYGLYFTGLKNKYFNLIYTKLPGKGPETCSGCHY